MPIPSDLKGLELQVYSAQWCGDCRRLERWLAEHQVSHTKVDLETIPGAAEKLEAETGKRAIPFILVNQTRWVPGYHKDLPSRFDPERLVHELLEAGRT
ncbi:MAG: glutaredoxin family protein [Holophaga sp.]|nr:glutaredoxin family protein [Holophaga sp.]